MSQLAFEMDFERHLVELAGEIRERSYKVMPWTAFLVKKPVLREVFAADFRDRVVHHLLANDIEPLVNRSLITDCYSCREGYGTSFGIDRIEHTPVRVRIIIRGEGMCSQWISKPTSCP